MRTRKTGTLRNCQFEIITRGREFVGLGRVRIGQTLIRSGRLPLSPYFETFSGRQLARLVWRGVESRTDRIVIKLVAEFTARPVAWWRDHSFDPIHDTADRDSQRIAGRGDLRPVLKPARENVEGTRFEGFSDHYEYEARDEESALFWIMGRASWELDGNILGATAISQSSSSAPQATFAQSTEWSTEGMLHFLIESVGPFGQVQHGCSSSYNVENLFACYKVGLGNDCTTMPTNVPVKDTTPRNAALLFYILAHKASLALPLFLKGKRIDRIWTAEQKQVLAGYHKLHAQMQKRFLQEDGRSVLWHDQTGKHATLWNFAERTVPLPGRVTDVAAGRELSRAEEYRLEANHVYVFRVSASIPS
jgi:hypothetical protein